MFIWCLLSFLSIYLVTTIKAHLCAQLCAMCSSTNPLWTDDRTITKIGIDNRDCNLPRELGTACSTTSSDPVVLFIHRYVDFSSKLYIRTNIFHYCNRTPYDRNYMIDTDPVSSYKQISVFIILIHMFEVSLYLFAVQCPSWS